jgi:hypothetical protein
MAPAEPGTSKFFNNKLLLIMLSIEMIALPHKIKQEFEEMLK